MKTELQVEITFDQILTMVKQLPKQQKIKLSRELEKDVVDSKLTKLLSTFKTNELSLSNITKEVELVRQELYEKKRRKGNL
jgi:replication fork clamp-binding protein CrfC